MWHYRKKLCSHPQDSLHTHLLWRFLLPFKSQRCLIPKTLRKSNPSSHLSCCLQRILETQELKNCYGFVFFLSVIYFSELTQHTAYERGVAVIEKSGDSTDRAKSLSKHPHCRSCLAGDSWCGWSKMLSSAGTSGSSVTYFSGIRTWSQAFEKHPERNASDRYKISK